jgi:hypothetical protein
VITVGQLKRAIAGMPDDMPVVGEDAEFGWFSEVGLFTAPAHFDRRYGFAVCEGLRPDYKDADRTENTTVLLISQHGQSDEGVVDITPKAEG